MTKIQWTDQTDNPIRVATGGHWCQKISPGCANCYAERINNTSYFSFASQLQYSGEPPELEFKHKIVEKWARIKRPSRIFVCSMTDLFGSWVSREWQFCVFDAAALAPSQTIQLLTKRVDVAQEAIREWCESRGKDQLPSNVWIGVTTETQKMAEERIGTLLDIPAATRFVSAEPLLEPLTMPRLSELDVVLIGGESGSKSRPCHIGWIRDLIGQCEQVNTMAFVKQGGSQFFGDDGKRITNNHNDDEQLLDGLGLLVRQLPERLN